MSFSIYVNDHNAKATVHDSDCHHVRKNGGKGKGYWIDSLDTYEEAWDYINNNIEDDYESNDCESCL